MPIGFQNVSADGTNKIVYGIDTASSADSRGSSLSTSVGSIKTDANNYVTSPLVKTPFSIALNATTFGGIALMYLITPVIRLVNKQASGELVIVFNSANSTYSVYVKHPDVANSTGNCTGFPAAILFWSR